MWLVYTSRQILMWITSEMALIEPLTPVGLRICRGNLACHTQPFSMPILCASSVPRRICKTPRAASVVMNEMEIILRGVAIINLYRLHALRCRIYNFIYLWRATRRVLSLCSQKLFFWSSRVGRILVNMSCRPCFLSPLSLFYSCYYSRFSGMGASIYI